MTGDLDMNRNDVNNVVDVVIDAQATAPESAAGKHKLYALDSAPTIMRALDDAGGEVYVAARHNIIRAYLGALADLVNGVWTKLPLDTESFDLESTFDAVTNYRFTPNVAGYYQVNWNVEFALYEVRLETEHNPFNWNKFSAFKSAVYKNGALHSGGSTDGITGAAETLTEDVYPESHGSDVIYLNGTTDYIELYAWGVNSSALDIRVKPGSQRTCLSAALLNVR